MREIQILDRRVLRTFIILICVSLREVCCVQYTDFIEIIEERKKYIGRTEEQYMVVVAAQPKKRFRVYANMPGTKGYTLTSHIISRSDFPGVLFEK